MNIDYKSSVMIRKHELSVHDDDFARDLSSLEVKGELRVVTIDWPNYSELETWCVQV